MGAYQCRADACDACDASALGETLSHPSMLGQQLLCAARDGDHVAVKVCLCSGADIEARQPLKLLTMDRYESGIPVRQRGFTPLMYASQGGYIKCVSSLLEARAKVNAQDEDGTSPLHLAAASGELGVFAALLSAGAFQYQDEDGLSPLDYLPEDVKKDHLERRRWDALCVAGDAVALNDSSSSRSKGAGMPNGESHKAPTWKAPAPRRGLQAMQTIPQPLRDVGPSPRPHSEELRGQAYPYPYDEGADVGVPPGGPDVSAIGSPSASAEEDEPGRPLTNDDAVRGGLVGVAIRRKAENDVAQGEQYSEEHHGLLSGLVLREEDAFTK